MVINEKTIFVGRDVSLTAMNSVIVRFAFAMASDEATNFDW
jgi:hypothetical protein